MQPVQQACGACIQCKAPRCLTAFHASCARRCSSAPCSSALASLHAAQQLVPHMSHVSCTLAPWLTRFAASSRSHGIYMAEKEKIKDGEEYVDKLVLCEKHRPADGAKKKRRKREIKW